MIPLPAQHRTFAAFVCCLVLLGACAPRVQEFQPGLMAAKIKTDSFVTEDGKPLPLKSWPAKGEARAVLVALHGFNMYSRYFDDPARWWAGRGITTYAYDQRGFGAAPEARIWGGAEAMAADARAFLALLGPRHAGLPIYLLGDSMGAAVAVLAMTSAAAPEPAPKVAGIILVAPGLWGGSSMHPILRFGLWLSAHTMPWNTATGRGLKRQASDNIPMLRALGRDPLVIRHTRIDAVYGVTQLMGQAYDAAPGLKPPALVLYGEKDEIVPAAPVRKTIKRLPRAPDFSLYPDGWHMLLRDLQAKVVWNDIAAWIQDPTAPLPSGAQAR
ncbi:MAG: alpha/beta hydrolase [Rhodospirillaceae bacterium]|jgi:acylglycerol lipase|nr:alpha/beta hydrolase [Rhodospirillaceae bacterium]MBT3493288.1 alpha/beta hydrolase [Rhodospirillaceae bacterium]MBT3782190.1 alpha/beta hydrolase [Rhodospirillaceae bacterium]MBT3977709.1 alpha/beta hydrolase [Rhodospirillaceae bacterium]MBT4167336.1 alpha/beta hydrolase [Rhodospirillaceae bacterium]